MPPLEIAFADSARENRHHPGDAGTAGDAQHVLRERGLECCAAERTEHRQRFALAIAAEQPFRESAIRLALDDEIETKRAAREVAHRVSAIPGEPFRREQHELPGIEVARFLQIDAERHHVVGEHPRRAQHDAAGGRRASARLRGVHELVDFERQIGRRLALAHQEFAPFRFDVLLAGRADPSVGHRAADESGFACAARAGCAFVRQRDAGAQSRMQNAFAGPRFELVAAVAGIDLDPHWPPLQNGTW